MAGAVPVNFHGKRISTPPKGTFDRITFLERAQEAVAALNLDALVFGDVGMDVMTTGLAYGRLSPVQVAFSGHPGTTGLPAIDYFITSDLYEGIPSICDDCLDEGASPRATRRRRCGQTRTGVANDGPMDTPVDDGRSSNGTRYTIEGEIGVGRAADSRQEAFAEQLVRLGDLNVLFDDPAPTFGNNADLTRAVNEGGNEGRDQTRSAGRTIRSRRSKQIRHGCTVCAQSLVEMHPAFDGVIAGILAQDPLAQIVLLRDSRHLL